MTSVAGGSLPAPAAPDGPEARGGGRRRAVSWFMLGVGVLILASGAWVGWRSYQAYANLEAASAEVADLQDQLTDITNVDSVATSATIGRLQAAAATARSAVDDPV